MIPDSLRAIVHMFLDCFCVSVSRLHHPKLEGRPVIVGRGERGVVAAGSNETCVFGVHSAMPIKLAKRLCPVAFIIRGDSDEYSKHSDDSPDNVSNITSYLWSTAGSLNTPTNDTAIATPAQSTLYTVTVTDINQDGNIDLSDLPFWDDDNTNFVFGYYATDLKADSNSDLSDFPSWDDNNTNFIFSHHP